MTRVRVSERYGDLPSGWTGTVVRSLRGERFWWTLVVPDGYTKRTIAVRADHVELLPRRHSR